MKKIFILFTVFALSFSLQAQHDDLLIGQDANFKSLNYSGLSFRVQVGAYKKLFDDPDAFFGIKGILPYDLGDGIIRYVTTYNYGDIESAELEKGEVVAWGITDAFIVPFYGNKRISQQKAIRLLKLSEEKQDRIE